MGGFGRTLGSENLQFPGLRAFVVEEGSPAESVASGIGHAGGLSKLAFSRRTGFLPQRGALAGIVQLPGKMGLRRVPPRLARRAKSARAAAMPDAADRQDSLQDRAGFAGEETPFGKALRARTKIGLAAEPCA